MSQTFFARTCERDGLIDKQRLKDHLGGVAELAAEFAGVFCSEEWGRVAGWWHDLGKYQEAFQRRLDGDETRVDHSVVGAALAEQKSTGLGRPLAFVIAGHHAGLADPDGPDAPGPRVLEERLAAGRELLDRVQRNIPAELLEMTLPEPPPRLTRRLAGRGEISALRRSHELWIRFLFSCLVDADRLDSEHFASPGSRAAVTAGMAGIAELRDRLDRNLDSLQQGAEPSEVNRLRAEILEACWRRAAGPPGVFSLTVPTGGGKTLSGMAFALEHALQHGMRRVIVAIPFTSIIEQNAAVYRAALGSENVIEHHANLDPEDSEAESEAAERRRARNRLACENWDAPVIVTTNVQLFESLLANRASRCRKVHNVANSVIVLDEVQTLPVGHLDCIVEVIDELRRNYGCSIVLSTATQPALRRRDSLPRGFDQIVEIAPEPSRLFDRLRRVEVDWQRLTRDEVTWDELAAEVVTHNQVLVVVHRRDDARQLAQLLPEEGRFHLSTLMCARHRKRVIDEVKAALEAGRTCRLVSTQLIEAGVDLDFPVVYRALAGLDSITQAAGRCNREGRLEKGQVILFRAPTPPPSGTPRIGLEATEEMLVEAGGEIDICDPDIFERFFRSLYFTKDLDHKRVQVSREKLKFATTASNFKLIDEAPRYQVVVPFGDGPRLAAVLAAKGPDRQRLRALQPYLVGIFERQFQPLNASGVLFPIPSEADPIVWALAEPYHHLYDERLGLVIDDNPQPSAESLVL